MEICQHIKINNKKVILGFDKTEDDLSQQLIHDVKNYVELGFRDFVFDFKAIEGIFSSITLGLVLGMANKISDSQGHVVLKNVNAHNRGLMSMTGIFKLKEVSVEG